MRILRVIAVILSLLMILAAFASCTEVLENREQGAQEENGEQDAQGEKGEQGAQGEQGEKGDKGDQGATGEEGDKGDQGVAGAQGEKGDKGDQGATGATGEKGSDGLGIKNVEIRDGELWITYTDESEVNAGAIIPEKSNIVKFDMYLLPDDTYALSAGDTFDYTRIEIPSTYKGKPVTTILDNAYKNAPNLVEIIIPTSITSVGYNTFSGTNIVDLTSPANFLPRFEDCPIKNLTVTGGDMINRAVFAGVTTLETLVVDDGVTVIGEQAFCGCTSLSKIVLTDDLLDISIRAFESTGYYNDPANWENDVLYIGNHLIEAKASVSGEYVVKDGVKSIARRAFKGCVNISTITIPDSVVSISSEVFQGCSNISNINLGSGLMVIGWEAFKDTAHYKDSSRWIDGALYIDNYLIATKASIAADYTVKDGTRGIGNRAFYESGTITKVTIPDSVIFIDRDAFGHCGNLTTVTIGNGVVSIGEQAFSMCEKLSEVNFGSGLKKIGTNAFRCCAIKELEFNDGLEVIGNTSFAQSALEKVVIPNSVVSIEAAAFSDCASLSSIIFEDKYGWFIYNSSLENGCLEITPTEITDQDTIIRYLTRNSIYAPTGYSNCNWVKKK